MHPIQYLQYKIYHPSIRLYCSQILFTLLPVSSFLRRPFSLSLISNNTGMCLHSCKAPAQELFDSLGLPLRVSPNFDTQECQWNFGEVAPEPQNDPTWPKGCLVGCGTRETVAEMRRTNNGTMADVANCY